MLRFDEIHTNKTFAWYYHSRFGSSARNCQSGGEFQKKHQALTIVLVVLLVAICNIVSDSEWLIFDLILQDMYVIDTGSSQSLTASTAQERQFYLLNHFSKR